MTWLIALNGPNGIGKSWFCQQSAKLFQGRVRIFSARDFIWDEVQSKYKWPGTYEEFKAHTFDDGTIGRELMIRHAEYRRKQDINYWVTQYCLCPKFVESDIILNDSLKGLDEQDGFFLYVKTFISIVIAPSQYSIGALYDDNYRSCVSPVNGFRAINSNIALESLKRNLDDAKSNRIQGTSWNSIHMDGFVA